MTPKAKRRAVSAGAAVVAAGAAVAVLEVLQQAIGAFEPRPIISALFVAAAFFAGLVAARARNRKAIADAYQDRADELRNLFGPWCKMTDADAIRLGVFPARRDAGSDRYVSRRIDDDLGDALVAGAIVVVIGEARAGASRTAFEVARSRIGSAFVLAPRTPRALRKLLALNLQLEADHIVVWLDGLDRYANVVDVTALAGLLMLGKHVTLLATIRRSDWDAWLDANGAAGRAARAVAGQARVFEIASELNDIERAEAREAYPHLDMSAGIGAAIASRGREQSPPARTRPEAESEPERNVTPQPTRDPWFLLPAAATCAALVVLAAVWASSGFSTPSIGKQLDDVIQAGSKGGRHAVTLRAGDLHSSGVRSHVILFKGSTDARAARSDELRIYDEDGNKLVRRLRFEPEVNGSPALFLYRGAVDVDGDGDLEIIGGFGRSGRDQGRQALVPFAIDWNNADGRYQVVSLDLGRPTLSGRPKILAEAQYRRFYERPTTFTDSADHLALTGHRVQDFIVTDKPYRLVAGWFLRPWIGSERATFELQVAIFDTSTGGPRERPCTFPTNPIVVRAGRDRLVTRVFEARYAAVSRSGNCAPTSFG